MTTLTSALHSFYTAHPEDAGTPVPGRVAIIIPTLNEARHITDVIAMLRPSAARLGAAIIVADGGSDDGTIDLVRSQAAQFPQVFLLRNPRKLQSAAINLAQTLCPPEVAWLIRIDAHAAYPDDYCDTLLQEARATGAESVVVSMHARGQGFMQRNIAAAQNGFVGNGGSAHRGVTAGQFVDHGHHALMRRTAFAAVGGYDESFSHNEDAELDARLRKADFRIWLTGQTQMTYFPRDTLRGLARQYYNFGRGRVATARKHPDSFRKRHLVLVSLAPIAAAAGMAGIHPIFAAPLALWFIACIMAGMFAALRQRDGSLAASGLPASVMQMAWSFGFWAGLLRFAKDRLKPTCQTKPHPTPIRKEGS